MAEGSAQPSLSVRTARGAGWVIVWRMCSRLMGVVNTVVLVRLLAPADFGLVALATSFSQIVEWLSGIGVNDALVRETHLDRALYDTGFTLNLLRGVLIAVAIAAEAFPVAGFFGDTRLADILLVLAATMFMGSLENIGVVDFRRDLAFEKEFLVAIVPRIASIVVSMTYAVVFRDFWALVAGIVTFRVLRVVLTYWMHPYRPSLTLRAYRRIIAFSLWSWVAATVMLARDRIDALVIGRLFGPTMVGIYSVGWEIGSLTSTELVEPVTAALFPGFAEARRTGGGVAEGYFKAISATFLLTLPMGVGLSMLAWPVIQLAFGARWLQAVPLVQVFALVCMVKVIAYFSAVLLNAYGLVQIQFRILAVALVIRVGLLAALVGRYGLMGAAMAATGCMVIEETIFLIYTFRRFKLRVLDLLQGIWRCTLATAAMAAALSWEGLGWGATGTGPDDAVHGLVLGVASGAVVYTAVLLLAWWATGRPRGAETVFLDVLTGMLRHLIRWRRA